jgi:cation diffusion facilitator family transporter
MEQKEIMRISVITMIGNIILSLVKLAAGIAAKSGAMISDAVHSASDVFSTIVVMIGVHIASKEEDEDHPYGHERMESIAAILLALLLLATGCGIGWNGLQAIWKAINGNAAELVIPGWLALAAAVVSIAVKELMYRATRRVAKRVRSDALMADAWHHRSDALSSVGSFVGIGGAILGFPVMDSVASVVICVFIVRAAWGIAAEAVRKMVDHSADHETEEAMRQMILSHDGVISLKMLKTREFGSKIYMDVIMTADPALTFAKAHDLAEKVHDDIEAGFPAVKHVMVHIEPDEHESSQPIFTQLNRHWHTAAKSPETAELLINGSTLTLRFPLCNMLYDSAASCEGVLIFRGCRRYAMIKSAYSAGDPYWEYGVKQGAFYRVENAEQGSELGGEAVILKGAEPDGQVQRYLLCLSAECFVCEAEEFTFAVEQTGVAR